MLKKTVSDLKTSSDFYIMVVDDETDFLDSIRYWFTSQGYKVEALSSGDEALEKIKQAKPGVVFLNLQMPNDEGLRTLRSIKEIAPDIPVIMLSAFGSEDMSIDAYKVGVNGFFDKSSNFYQAEHLMNTLVRVVSRRRRPETEDGTGPVFGPAKRFSWKRFLLWLLVFLFSAIAVFVLLSMSSPRVCFGDKGCLRVELARTEQERLRGLMFRRSLPHQEGMLFIFPDEGIWGIWMKNTLIPLDVIWMDASGRVVNIAANLQPAVDQNPAAYRNERPAKFVLEANAGFAEKNRISVGDQATIIVK